MRDERYGGRIRPGTSVRGMAGRDAGDQRKRKGVPARTPLNVRTDNRRALSRRALVPTGVRPVSLEPFVRAARVDRTASRANSYGSGLSDTQEHSG